MQIRLATAADAAAVRSMYAPYVERSVVSFELTVPSEEEMAARITERQPQHPWLVADTGDAIAGYAYAGRFSARPAYDWSAETSVYIAEDLQGRGVGRLLYAALLALLTVQGYRQVMAGVTLPNEASVRLHERFGFRPVGVYRAAGWKFGSWHDVGWWQLSLAAGGKPPTPPLPLTSLPADVLRTALTPAPPRPGHSPDQ